MGGHLDEDVLRVARDSGRVLVSADTDFGGLLARQGSPLPSLILFRQGNRTPQHQVATLLANVTHVVDDLDAGAIVVLTDESIRVRRLPINA